MLDESKNLGLGVGECGRHSVIYTVKAYGISLVTALQGFDGGFLRALRCLEWVNCLTADQATGNPQHNAITFSS